MTENSAELIRAVCEQTLTAPEDRRKVLARIAADAAEPYSVRQDARRLLELDSDDFDYRYAEFIELRRTYTER